MGDSDEETYAQYGTALDPIEEDDALASKKPIRIQDQVATDERGRRRFHGAFTGGFSAGYFNTVGSKEGWAPSTFKSSRAERANVKQNASDYMDEEDKGAFGIAPHMLRTTSDFSTSDILQSRKRKREEKPSDGPIPGVPVLHQVLEPVKETVGIRMLIRMGWRPGQGIGPKLSREDKKRIRTKEKRRKEKIAARKAELEKKSSTEPEKIDKIEDQEIKENDDDNNSAQKMYGCSIPLEFLPKLIDIDDVSSSDDEDLSQLPAETDILLAPDDVQNPLCNPKENSFGHGYKGLDRNTILGGGGVHIDLFGASHSFKVGGNKNKLNITGEAFGIGAFENVDIDVYNNEDMGEYDFALETPEERKRRMTKEALNKASRKKSDPTYIVGFRKSTTPIEAKKYFRPPTLPENYKPSSNPNKKRSRFDDSREPTISHPIIQNQIRSRANKFSGVDQFQQQGGKDQGQQNSRRSGAEKFQLSIQERGALLGEDPERKREREIEAIKSKEISDTERLERLGVYEEALKKVDVSVQNANQISFKPFMRNPEKQARYEKYILLVGLGFKDCLKDLQPDTLLDWELERERLEFERASTLYKPGNNVMSSRFISAKSHDISHLAPEKENAKENDPTKDAKLAAKMKLFGKLTHRVMEWHPDKLVCKRMNIPSPYPNSQIVGLIPDHTASESKIIKSASSVAPFNQFNTTPTAGIVESIGGTAEKEQEQPKEKKSLFDNLDFSKPPPGVYPLDSFNPSILTQPPPATGVAVLNEEEPKPPGEETVITAGNEPLVPTRPSMDLFKEIFDASSSEESEDEEKDKRKESKSSTNTSTSSKKDYSQERNNYNKVPVQQQQQQSRRNDRETRDTVRSSELEEKSQDKDKASSLFQNLDLDRMNMSTKLLTQNQRDIEVDHLSKNLMKKRKIAQVVDEEEHSFYYYSRKERENRQKDQEKEQDVNSEEEQDTYGPQVPFKPPENSSRNTTTTISTTNISIDSTTSNRNSLTGSISTSTDLLHQQKHVYSNPKKYISQSSSTTTTTGSSTKVVVVDEKDNIWIEKDTLIKRKHSSTTTTSSSKSKKSKSHHKSKKNKSKSHKSKSKKKSHHKKKSSKSKSKSKSSSNHKNKVVDQRSGSSSSNSSESGSISDSEADDTLEKSRDSEMEMAILAKLRGLRENKLI